jgi:spermidine synthase
MAYLLVIGFISILGQVVLLRELNVAFYGVELIYTLAIGVWLFSSGCGAIISRRANHHPVQTKLLLIISALILPLTVAFIRSIRLIFAGIPGAYLPLHRQMVAMCIAILPLGLVLGQLFQRAAKAYVAEKRTLAGAYAIESLGGLAGGICSTLFLKFGMQNFFMAVLCSMVAAGTALLHTEKRETSWPRLFSPFVVGLLLVLLWKAPVFDHFMTSWTHPNVVDSRDSPYSRITITLFHGQTSVFENDALIFDSEGTQAEELVHISALQHPDPQSVLVLGGGIEGIVYEVMLHSPRIVDYVELNSTLLRMVPPHLSPEIQRSLRAQNVRIIPEDPRRFLNRSSNYDVIIIGMPDPTSGQANRFYTREFFQKCYEKLNAHGVVAFSIQSSENIWTPQLTNLMVSIYRAAKSAFPEIIVVPGSTNVVICSRDRLTRDPTILASRLDARKIHTQLISAAYLKYLYTNDRFSEVARTLESGTAPMNTDKRPICYQYTILIWLSKFLPSARSWNFTEGKSAIGIGVIIWSMTAIFILAWLLSRLRWSIRRVMLTFMAGLAGMVMETILILHFQIKNGILYQDVGILLTSFMAGLALGAMFAAKTLRSPTKPAGFALLSAFTLLGGFIGWGINSGRSSGLMEILVLMLLTGFFVAGIFGYASLHRAEDQSSVVAPLYSADLIGGCVGSILASLALVPLAGLGVAAYWLLPLALLSVFLL